MAVLVEQWEWCGVTPEQGMRSRNTVLGGLCWQSHSHQGDLIAGGKRLCSLENGELLLQSLNCWQQLSSSREEEWAFIPRAKIAAESCCPSACGAQVALGWKVLQKGATFSRCWKTQALESQWNVSLWVLVTDTAQPDGEQDLRRTPCVPWRQSTYVTHHWLLITSHWCTQSETLTQGSHFMVILSWCWWS